MTLVFGALRAMDPSRPEPQSDIASLENPEVLEREMKEAGFRTVELLEVESEISAVDSPEEFWASMVRGTAPLVLLRRHLGEAAWAEGAERAIGYLRDVWREPMRLASVAHLAIGTK